MTFRGQERLWFLGLFLLAVGWLHDSAYAQAAQSQADADRLRIPCSQILKMSSTQWIVYWGEKTKSDGEPSVIARASTAYGKCYDTRTDGLAASLARSGKGPSKAARADFAQFEAALRDFITKALADTGQSGDLQKNAYAALYEKQFRLEFYQAYEPKIEPPSNRRQSASDARSSAPEKNTLSEPSGTSSSSAASSAGTDADEMTKAKNRFGELLGALPDDKLHQLHAAFGEVIGLHTLSDRMRMALYRYAIFLLEPGPEQNSYPPPF